MIKVNLHYNKKGDVYRFRVLNHGESFVCAGVSALVITCVNFIEAKLDASLTPSFNPERGYIELEIPCDKLNQEICLIVEHMVFGLTQMEGVYNDQIKISKKVSE